ncbi:GTP-binding protein 1 [Porphyridium purpureum]|uniref:GTP-binding protein 1 n=1 Tax=Porphyridium purpureum TaxID=35688 RepID=A0A5J4Z9E6_PORPP|nr:GTP-binding protein 1 [Porphyridium purpureum]|eukprot:POR0462..scf295_1
MGKQHQRRSPPRHGGGGGVVMAASAPPRQEDARHAGLGDVAPRELGAATKLAQTQSIPIPGVLDVAASRAGAVEHATSVESADSMLNAKLCMQAADDAAQINPARGLAESVASLVLDDLPVEDDEGSVEYKWSLVNPSPERLVELVTQMQFRLMEGNGECIYELGVEDNGRKRGLPELDLQASLDTLRTMAAQLSSEVMVLSDMRGHEGRVATVMVRRTPASLEERVDLRVAVAGNVDSGKSTLVGVLTGTGTLDNGRGLARAAVFSHRHELESGRTSAVSTQIMGFSAAGGVVNYTNSGSVRALNWSDVVEHSSKIVTFYDLAGHERYLKTTMFGLTACVPDYCMLVIAANNGVLRMTKEHLCIALALKVPVFVVITKLDICPENIREQTLTHIQKILKSPGARKIPVLVRSKEDLSMCAQNIVNDRIVPIFAISNVTGEGLDDLRLFMNLLHPRRNWAEVKSNACEFSIDDIFAPVGVGTVVAGTVVSGCMTVNDDVWLGPDSAGHFTKVHVKSIHYKRCAVKRLVAGQSGSLALKKIKRSSIRKGMYLLESATKPGAVREFSAEVLILVHATSIRENYQPIIHVETVRQAAQVVGIDKDVLRTGDRANIHFRFMYQPEYIKVGSRFIFREGRTKGLGIIKEILQTV